MATTEFFTRHWHSGGFPSTWELLSLTIKLSLHSYTYNTGQRLQFLQCFNHPYGIWMQVCWPRLQKKTVIRHPRMHFHPFQSQFCIATTQNSSETGIHAIFSHVYVHCTQTVRHPRLVVAPITEMAAKRCLQDRGRQGVPDVLLR